MLLRKLQMSDFHFLKKIETNSINNEGFKLCTDEVLLSFITNRYHDFLIEGEIRLLIEIDNEPVGFIDLFEYNKKESSAKVGIIIETKKRQKGFAKKAINLLKIKALCLNLKVLKANISTDNKTSIALFEKCEFKLHSIINKIGEWKYSET